MNSPTILYLHIPKAAGSTLGRILDQRCQKGRVLIIHNTRRATEELMAVPEAERVRLQLVRGHYPYGIHECLTQPFEYVTILRDPVERIISHYYYLLRHPAHYLYNRVTSEKMGIKEYLQAGLTKELDNGQTRLISGYYNRDPYGQCQRELLDLAKENLRNHFAVVGLAERFDETVLLLSQKLKLGWNNMYYVRENVTPDRPRREQLSADVMEAINAVNHLDVELYAFAAKLFETAIGQERSSFERTLAEYRTENEAYGRCCHDVSKR